MYEFLSPEASLGSAVLNSYTELSGMEFEYLSFNKDYGYGTIKNVYWCHLNDCFGECPIHSSFIYWTICF